MDITERELGRTISEGHTGSDAICSFLLTCPHRTTSTIHMSTPAICSQPRAEFVYVAADEIPDHADLKKLEMLKKVFELKEAGYWRL